VIRISLVPFDLGSSDRDVCRESLRDLGYSKRMPSPIEARTLGPGVTRFSHRSRDWDLYVDEGGFGVARLRYEQSAALGDAGAVAAHLVARRKCHEGLLGGGAELCEEIDRMRSDVVRRVQPEPRQGLWDKIKPMSRKVPEPAQPTARQGFWDGVPYEFSFFLLARTPGPLTDDEARCLRALSEPSLIDEGLLGQGRVEPIAEEIASLPVSGLDEALADIDRSPRVTAHATWAGLAVMHGPGQATETEEIYVSLEVRVQLVWSAAFFARRWSERSPQAGAVQVGEVEELRLSVLSAARRVRRISDAAIPTRFRAILAEMAATSGLDEEAEHADAAFARMERSLAAAERRGHERLTVALAAATFFLLANEILPLAFKRFLVNPLAPVVVAVALVAAPLLTILIWFRGKE